MKKLYSRVCGFSAALLVGLTFPTPLLAAGELHVGYSAISAAVAPLWAAQERGFFKRHGLATELVYFAGGSLVALGIEADSIQIGLFNVGAGVEARLAGGGMLIIGSVYDVYYFQIFGKPTIQSPKELKGKVIAASRAGAASEYGIRDALAYYGLKESDYKIVYVGGTDARVQALQQGLVDASIISPPNGLIAQKLGFKEVLNLMQMKLPFGYIGIGAKDSWVRQNPDAVRNFLRGYLEGLALCRRDREYAIRLIGKFSRIDDREILLESYRTSIPHIPERPYVKKEIVEAALKLSKREAARNADPEKFYDNSVVKEIEASGFIASLFGKN
ncbi:MAG: ABC transporter substrate-binding protein [Deltaproteobacteria bacterium]|nr:ABC transporter substrate-binding protein [Deltaproteobacteria bacterium]